MPRGRKNNPQGHNQYTGAKKSLLSRAKAELRRIKKKIGDIPIQVDESSSSVGATRRVTTLSGRRYSTKPTKKQMKFVSQERDRVAREQAAALRRFKKK